MWGGAAQFLLTALVLTVQFKHYFIAQSQQIAPHMGGVNSTGEAVVTVLIVLEFLFHKSRMELQRHHWHEWSMV